jgi:predicted RNA binding protein YcfA (HicA-like mRNA interferase family)
MPKLPIIKPREIIRILHKIGFIDVRSKRSHLQLRKGNLLVTVLENTNKKNIDSFYVLIYRELLSS